MTEFGLPSDKFKARLNRNLEEQKPVLGLMASDALASVHPLRPVDPPGNHGASWREGWKACDEAGVEARVEWHLRGYKQGVEAGRAMGPTWANICFVAVFAFWLGGALAYVYL